MKIKSLSHHPNIIKLFNWEYWPFNVVYGPIYPYWLWLALKSRSFFFFNAANPGITNGGFLMDSKEEIYNLIPNQYYPPTVFFEAGAGLREVNCGIQKKGLRFPLVAKPNVGQNGRMVKTLYDETDLKNYLGQIDEPFIVQQWIEWEREIGLFYYRFPGEEKGHISGIVEKLPLTVTGDGTSTIEQLIVAKKRAILQWKFLKQEYKNELQVVLPAGKRKVLVSYGNHIRGSKFIDVSNLIDEKLTAVFNQVCGKVSSFHYGRLDIRFSSWEELKEGKNFAIIELNGSGSEPTHIYDSNHSIFFAWKEIIRHWIILQRISMRNHRIKSIPFLSFKEGIRMLRDHRSHLKKVKDPKK